MLKRTCVDQHHKKAFIFYTNDRIAEIKVEEDCNSQERFKQKTKEIAETLNANVEKSKKKIDTTMSNLIKKAMEGKK